MPRGRREPLEFRVPRVIREYRVLRGLLASLASLARLAPKAQPEYKALLATSGLKGRRVVLESRA